MKLWLNYQNRNSYNRIAVKKCNKKNDNGYECAGCLKTVKTNPLNQVALNEISWTLVANFEKGNLNYQVEKYLIDIVTSLNASNPSQIPKLKSFWKLINFPSLEVSQNLLFLTFI